MTTIEHLQSQIKDAKRDVERAKIMYYGGHGGTYDAMAEAAQRLSALMFEYQKTKFPALRPKRIPYQAILR